jgi:hypothetical protein
LPQGEEPRAALLCRPKTTRCPLTLRPGLHPGRFIFEMPRQTHGVQDPHLRGTRPAPDANGLSGSRSIDSVHRHQVLARAAKVLRHSMAAACLRRLITGPTMERVRIRTIAVNQGRTSGDVQTNCHSLTLSSSHCTAVQRSIIVALTLFAPRGRSRTPVPKVDRGGTSAPRLLWRWVLIRVAIRGSART